MLEKMEYACRKTPDKNYDADVCRNSITNGNRRIDYIRRSKLNDESFSRAPARYYRLVNLIQITLDKGVEVDMMRCKMHNMWSENVRLKEKIEALSKVVPLKKDYASEEKNEMVKKQEENMVEQKNINEDLSIKLL